MDLPTLLDTTLNAAKLLDGSISPTDPEEHRGMGSITLLYHPYECKWQAFANWSDNSDIKAELAETSTEAVAALLSLLENEKKHCKYSS